jgi:D-beta-D-heptose 7-phosphate kinase/D-beta-D-heptose 1-phosphate adenosyltransferase
VVDPKGRDFGKYRGATLVTPNRQELALATGLPTETDEDVAAAGRRVIEAHGIAAVLATRSERGMTLVERDAVHHLPARAREVFDVSGAGDTVVAIVAASIAAGAPLPLAAKLANLGAGVVVGKVGTAVVHPAEILTALHESEFMDAEAKVATLQTMLDRALTWRRRGWRVGFTNGCFDLLHPGHVSLLKQARAACDRLVVGLNSDSSVKRLKGADRPIQGETSRAAVLASLAAVDLVVIFHEDDPMKLINALRPDVLVKGADYRLDEVVGAAEVQSWGGKVVLANILNGHSTSDTIRRMAP